MFPRDVWYGVEKAARFIGEGIVVALVLLAFGITIAVTARVMGAILKVEQRVEEPAPVPEWEECGSGG